MRREHEAVESRSSYMPFIREEALMTKRRSKLIREMERAKNSF
jgi:hypothetical protein